MLDWLSMPKRRVIPKRGSPDPDVLFDDDSGAQESAPLSIATDAPKTKPRFEARLIIEKGDHAGRVLKLDGGTAMIGRSSKCELALKGSAGVSRRHCKLQLINSRYAVIDLSSRNGTVVNGKDVSRKFLSDGDVLAIGDEHIRFIAKTKTTRVDDDGVSEQATALKDRRATHGGSALSAPPAGAERTTSLMADARQAPFDDDLAPRGYDDNDRLPPPLDERSEPYTLRPQRSAARATRALLIFALLIAVAFGVVALDVVLSGRRLLMFARSRVPALTGLLEDAPAALVSSFSPVSDVSQGAASGALAPVFQEREGSTDGAVAPAPEEKDGSSVVPSDEAKKPADGTEGDASIVVKAATGGRIGSLRVKPGTVVTKGQALVMLEAPGALRRKLKSLRGEERAFEQAVKKGNLAARRDLAAVREDIAELAPRVRGTPLVSDADGTVVEVLVKDGQAIKSGQPLVSIAP